MAVSVVMPALELAQESGKLLAWLKQEGNAAAKGEMIGEQPPAEDGNSATRAMARQSAAPSPSVAAAAAARFLRDVCQALGDPQL